MYSVLPGTGLRVYVIVPVFLSAGTEVLAADEILTNGGSAIDVETGKSVCDRVSVGLVGMPPNGVYLAVIEVVDSSGCEPDC